MAGSDQLVAHESETQCLITIQELFQHIWQVDLLWGSLDTKTADFDEWDKSYQLYAAASWVNLMFDFFAQLLGSDILPPMYAVKQFVLEKTKFLNLAHQLDHVPFTQFHLQMIWIELLNRTYFPCTEHCNTGPPSQHA